MAETKTVKLNVESNVDEVTQEFKKTGTAINATTDDVKKFNEQTVKGSDDVVKSQKKVQASLKQTAKDAKKGADSFKEFKDAGDGVRNSFQTAQGAMELFGVESEATGEAIQKVGQVMQLSDGIKGLKTGATAWKTFGTSAITALRGMSTALVATGIGALVVGVGLLVAYWDDIKSALTGVSSEQEKINEETETSLALEQEKLDAIGQQENLLKLQGKSEREILEMKLAQTDAVIENTKQFIAGKKTAAKLEVEQLKRNQQIAETIAKVALTMATSLLRIITIPLDALISTVNAASEFLGMGEAISFSLGGALDDMIDKGAKAASTFLFDADGAQENADKVIKEQEAGLLKLENDRAGFVLRMQKMDQDAANNRVKAEQEANAKILKARDDLDKALIKLQNDLLDELAEVEQDNFNKTLTDKELEEQTAREKYFRLKTLAENEIEDEEERKHYLEQIEIMHLNNMNDINNKYFEIEDAANKKRDADDKARTKKNKKDKIDAAKAEADAIAAIREADIANVEAGINLVASLAKDNKKVQAAAIIAENAVGVAKTIISTQAANAAALATPQAIATSGLAAAPVIARNNIAAGLSIATSVAATAQGLSALKEPGTPDKGVELPGAQGGGTEIVSPEFNIVGDSGINDLEGLGGQPPIQAFVTSQDVTTAQGLDRARIENATI